MSLFRPAALQARHVQWLGDIILIRPPSFAWLCGGALLMAALTLLLLLRGSYTQHVTVAGQLTPQAGLVKVYAPQGGIIVERRVAEGQTVAKGEILYIVSSERQGGTDGGIQAEISRQVALRRQSLQDELEKTRRIQLDDQAALRQRIAALRSELAKIEAQTAGQHSRAKLSEEALARAQELLARGYISREQLQQKQAELLDQRNRLQELERAHIGAGRDLAALENDAASAPLRQQNQLAQLDRLLASTGQELTESEGRRRVAVSAPAAGIATAISAAVGQAADPARPLAHIVPAGSELRAELYAPSSAVGFVRPGDTVLLRYQAYPYQKFGHARGRVAAVARTALPAAELGNMAASGAPPGQALYLITVTLASQHIAAYGAAQRLQAGMLLDADVQQDTRRLYEWVLEPLYSLTGKL